MRAAWTDEDIKTLRLMHSRGRTLQEMADALGRSLSAVNNRLFVLGEKKERSKMPHILKDWPDLPADAFKDVKVSADPKTPMAKPVTRTLAGTVGVLG